MWRLCGKLWTRAVKWTLKREELLSSRIEFNRQRIVLYSFSLFLASFVYPRSFIRQTMHGYCSIIFITFRHHFHRVCPLFSTLYLYLVQLFQLCSRRFFFSRSLFLGSKKNVDSRDKYLFSHE